MTQVAVTGTAVPVLLRNALHWSQAISSPRVGLMTRRHSHIKPLPIQRHSAIIAGLWQTANIIVINVQNILVHGSAR